MYLELKDNLESQSYSPKYFKDAGFRGGFRCLHYNIYSEDFTIILKLLRLTRMAQLKLNLCFRTPLQDRCSSGFKQVHNTNILHTEQVSSSNSNVFFSAKIN